MSNFKIALCSLHYSGINMNSLKSLSAKQLEYLPSEEEIVLYEKRGWFITDCVLPDELLDAGVRGTEDFYKGDRDYKHKEILGPANDVFSEEKALMNNEFVAIQKQEIHDIVFTPIVSAIAAKLSRTKEIRLFADALMCKFPQKPEDNGIFGWHTDGAYWPSCTSKDMITAWIPFQDCTVQMAPLIVIENSHKWEFDEALRKFCAAGNTNLTDLKDYLEERGFEHKYITMNLKKGQISYHHRDAFHCSDINTSDKKRISLTVHMQDEKNSFRQAYKPNGDKIIIGYERMCSKLENGDPNYRDPVFFPVLWDQKASQ